MQKVPGTSVGDVGMTDQGCVDALVHEAIEASTGCVASAVGSAMSAFEATETKAGCVKSLALSRCR